MSGIYAMQSLSASQAHGLQHYEAKISFCGRASQLGFSSQKSGFSSGSHLCGLSYEKRKQTVIRFDFDSDRQRRATWKSQVSHRKADKIRGLRCTPAINAPHSLENDTASTTPSTESPEQQQNGNSDNYPESSEQGVAVSTGLSALDAYFSKLKTGTGSSPSPVEASKSNSASTVIPAVSEQHKEGMGLESRSCEITNSGDAAHDLQGLKSLDAYFEKLNPKKSVPKPTVKDEVQPVTKTGVELTDEELFMKSLLEAKEDYEKYQSSRKEDGSRTSGDLKFQVRTKDSADRNEVDFAEWEVSDERGAGSNLINILIATNIAVYLFGLASPYEALGMTDSSLPFLYGAKVNELMLDGQWWRFITPMFLHASWLHLGLGSWTLLAFGPAVENAYGTLGFAMIYFLGGIFGDLMSFFHTPEWTVGGTGPLYALVGTWVVYLLKNREIIGKEIADDMIRKVAFLSAINVALCNSPPIDDWTHLGAILIGTLFGILASPTMQLNVSVEEEEDDDTAAYLWFNNGSSPAKLTLIFALCLGIFFIFYQLAISGSMDFLLLQDSDVFS